MPGRQLPDQWAGPALQCRSRLGTSAAAPSVAAIMAMVVQNAHSRQGQADVVPYPLAAAQSAANCNTSEPPQPVCVINDITQGNNSVPGQTGASAGLGRRQYRDWDASPDQREGLVTIVCPGLLEQECAC